jgi:hypothetical protein
MMRTFALRSLSGPTARNSARQPPDTQTPLLSQPQFWPRIARVFRQLANHLQSGGSLGRTLIPATAPRFATHDAIGIARVDAAARRSRSGIPPGNCLAPRWRRLPRPRYGLPRTRLRRVPATGARRAGYPPGIARPRRRWIHNERGARCHGARFPERPWPTARPSARRSPPHTKPSTFLSTLPTPTRFPLDHCSASKEKSH